VVFVCVTSSCPGPGPGRVLYVLYAKLVSFVDIGPSCVPSVGKV